MHAASSEAGREEEQEPLDAKAWEHRYAVELGHAPSGADDLLTHILSHGGLIRCRPRRPSCQKNRVSVDARTFCLFERIDAGMACAICLEISGPDDVKTWRKLPCGHMFHDVCLTRMIEASRICRCPLCRFDLQR